MHIPEITLKLMGEVITCMPFHYKVILSKFVPLKLLYNEHRFNFSNSMGGSLVKLKSNTQFEHD